MKEVSVALVDNECGDWSGLFVDGKLEMEGHSIYEHDWVELIHRFKHFKRIDKFTVRDEYMEIYGSFPSDFIETPKEAFV